MITQLVEWRTGVLKNQSICIALINKRKLCQLCHACGRSPVRTWKSMCVKCVERTTCAKNIHAVYPICYLRTRQRVLSAHISRTKFSFARVSQRFQSGQPSLLHLLYQLTLSVSWSVENVFLFILLVEMLPFCWKGKAFRLCAHGVVFVAFSLVS